MSARGWGLRFLAVACAWALLAGCPTTTDAVDEVEIYATSAAPPGGTATVTNGPDDWTISVTRGVAIAIRCWDTCTWSCEQAVFSVADPTLLEVHDVFRLGGSGEYLLLGAAAGNTQLTVQSPCADRVYAVEVLEQ